MRRGGALLATLAAVAAGAGVAVQTSVNGHANVIVGSPIVATAINHSSALVLAVVVAVAMGAFPRAVRSFRRRRAEVRWWWFLGGLMGAAAVFAIILVTPDVGVVAVGVAVTLGQLAGSVMADSGGLGPGGKRPLSPFRFAGIAVAVVAVAAGALGRFAVDNLVVILVVIAAGVVIALQQAANAWLIEVTGEFSVMSVINFAISTLFVGSALVVSLIATPVDLTAIPWWAPLGGVLGAVIGVASALAVRIIGVLSLILCIAAGQALGSIVMDLLVPVDTVGLTPASIVAAALSVAAVALAGMGSLPRRGRVAAATPDPLP